MGKQSNVGNSIWNAIANLIYIAVNGLLGLIVTKSVIQFFGSDINGINASSFEMVNILLVLEGGLTLATNVALFAPIKTNDIGNINAILSATNIRFKKIGFVFIVLGTFSSLLYSFFVHTDVSYWTVVYFFIMSLLPSAVNLMIAMKYRSILLSNQKEYVISIITLVTVVLGYSCTLIAIYNDCGIWSVKAFTTFFSLLNSLIIVLYCRKHYKYLDFSMKPDYNAIKGTKDVFLGKISGALFSALPILIISILFPNGAKLASVYAVYASVFSFLFNAIQAFASAPRFAFGQLFVDGDIDRIKELFLKYEFIVFVFQTLLMGCALGLILKFVDLYTFGVSDIQYHNPIIALILGLTFYISIIHKPSGHIINMSGNFKAYKIINFSAVIALFCFTFLAYFVGKFFNCELYGVLIGVAAAALTKCILEIGYTHKKILHLPLSKTIRMILANSILTFCCFLISPYLESISNFFYLAVSAFVVLAIISVITFVVNYVFNKEMLTSTIQLVFKWYH